MKKNTEKVNPITNPIMPPAAAPYLAAITALVSIAAICSGVTRLLVTIFYTFAIGLSMGKLERGKSFDLP